MSVEVVGLLGILLMFLLMFLKIPIAISMAVPAIIGIIYLRDWNAFATTVESIVWEQTYTFTLITIPLFVLMGTLLYVCGISTELFRMFQLWLNKIKGGLGIATIGSSAMFAAASGSSLANTATMGVIATKEMLNAGYSKSLTGGSIAAGGTIGAMVPPSTLFIIYGTMTEQSIGQLLVAGIIPGIILALFYALTVLSMVLIKPNMAPKISEMNSVTWRERIASLKSTIWIVVLFVVVIGGMYMGLFTPTEAAAVGAFFSFIIAMIRKKLTFSNFIDALLSTLKTTGFLFAIIIMAFILNYFLTITRVPIMLADFLNELALPTVAVFAIIVLMYVLLGAVMDGLAMLVITIPIVLPLIEILGFDLIWFGVIVILVMEMGMLSPPIGMNCFVLKGAAPELPLGDIFKGASIFLIPLLGVIAILYLFPELVLFLPSNMYQ